MTAQTRETLIYQGRELSMCSTPLFDYFSMGGINPGFQWTSTATWRGYHGTWEIKDDRLYLIGIDGELLDGQQASISSIFNSFSERVFAHWYTGILRIPQGELIKYVHGGYGSTYEKDLFLEIEKGILLSSQICSNEK